MIRSVAVLVGLLLLVAPVCASTGWLETHDNRIALTIGSASIGSDLTQFPVAIYITNSSGLSGANLSFIFDEVGDDYEKVAITSSDGSTVLYTEVECWSAADEQALLWVSPDLSSAENNTLYLYYDAGAPDNSRIGWTGTAAAEAVWDSSFVGVWHMADKPGDANTVLDSTSNGNDGTKNGGMAAATWQDVGMGQVFDGTDDYVRTLNDASLETPIITIEGYVNPSDSTFVIAEKNYETAYEFYNIYGYLNFHGKIGGVYTSNFVRTVDHVVTLDSLNALAVTYDGVTAYIYVNGISVPITQSTTGTIGTNTNILDIGSRGNFGWLLGTISEVRISSIARSDAWIGATHLSNTDALVTFSTDTETPEFVDGVPFVLWLSLVIGAALCGLHCWTDTENAKHLQIVSGLIAVIVLLWAGMAYAGGSISYYLDDGVHTIQDSTMPWLFGLAALLIGAHTAGYFAELFYTDIEEEEY